MPTVKGSAVERVAALELGDGAAQAGQRGVEPPAEEVDPEAVEAARERRQRRAERVLDGGAKSADDSS